MTDSEKIAYLQKTIAEIRTMLEPIAGGSFILMRSDIWDDPDRGRARELETRIKHIVEGPLCVMPGCGIQVAYPGERCELCEKGS